MGIIVRIVAIIQARMSSSRLPGKVLLPLAGKSVLSHIIDRLANAKLVTNILVATSEDRTDDPIAEFCSTHCIEVFRGSLSDVLDRFYNAAKNVKADVVVRITADCPMIDPVIVDAVITGFLSGNYDLYGLAGEFPDGLDCTAISFNALKKAWKNAKLKSEREHVCPYIENNGSLFSVGGLYLFENLGHLRWTLDETCDYELLKNIFDNLYNSSTLFHTHDVLCFLKNNQELLALNSSIVRNEGYIKSLKKERLSHD